MYSYIARVIQELKGRFSVCFCCIFSAHNLLFPIFRYIMCQICHSYHDSVEELNAHYESDHPTGSGRVQPNKEGKFPCELCDKSFARTQGLYHHQRKSHGRKKMQEHRPKFQGSCKCEVCGAMLSTKGKLKEHIARKH